MYVLVGEFPTPTAATRKAQATPGGRFPLGTAFAVWTNEKTVVFSANHILTEHPSATSWWITPSVNRQSDGAWSFEQSNMIKVNVRNHYDALDLVVLVRENGFFKDEGMIHICGSHDIPTVADEYIFKTYYCAIQDIQEDHSGPPVTAAPTECKKMYGITRGHGGKVWFRGGLCSGSSGGVVVDHTGRAIGMHIASVSPSKDVAMIQAEDKLTGKKRSDDERQSESTNSIFTDHSSSQVCLLLSDCTYVATYIE